MNAVFRILPPVLYFIFTLCIGFLAFALANLVRQERPDVGTWPGLARSCLLPAEENLFTIFVPSLLASVAYGVVESTWAKRLPQRDLVAYHVIFWGAALVVLLLVLFSYHLCFVKFHPPH